MKPSKQPIRQFGFAAALGAPFLAALLLASLHGAMAQAEATRKDSVSPATNTSTTTASSTNSAAAQTNAPLTSLGGTNAVSATGQTNAPGTTNTVSAAGQTNAPGALTGTNAVTTAAGQTNAPSASETNAPSKDIQLSFQGADVNMICQWLSQNTGKSVVKHPRVQCQITITSSGKINPREAVTLIYRALALEGFNVTETAKAILIGPDDKDIKLSPELMGSDDVPEGKQKLVKVFTLQHVQAADLKEKIKAFASEKATVDVDERANRIIVTDYTDNIALIKGLLAKLDTDNPANLNIRIIPLKHGSARDLAREISPLYQKMNTKGPKEVVEVSANERSNSLMVMSSQTTFEVIEKLVADLDTEGAQERAMRTFTLKNADPQDLAKQLQDLYQEEDNNRMPWYYYSYSPGKDNKKMSVVADRRRNAVIVQAIPTAMDQIADMIAKLDAPVEDNGLAPKIHKLKFVNAGDIEDILNELFLKKEAPKRRYWFDDEPAQPNRDVGRLYGKVRITSEPHANAIIITANSQENLEAIEEILNQLDIPSDEAGSTLRIQINHAKASTVANSINVLFAKSGAPPLRPVAQNNQQNPPQQQQQGDNAKMPQNNYELSLDAKEDVYYPWLGGQQDGNGDRTTRPVSELVSRVRAVADYRSNSLLISANPHFFPQIVKLIEEMDVPTAQVLIEARIVEVSSDYLDKLGVRWSPDGSQVFTADDYDNSFLAGVDGRYIKEFGQSFGPASQALAKATHSGVVDTTLSMDFLVQFLRRTTDATVLAEPQISIADNEMGRLFVGSRVPFITQSSTYQGSLNQSFEYMNVGVILEVTPHININGDVALRIRAESSSIVPGQTLFGGAIIDTRNFRTDLTAKNGQTLVLGGIIQKQISETIRKVPLLGDIPVLGYLFKKKDKTNRQVELMVFLRPRIVRNSEEARGIVEDIPNKAPLVQDWLNKNNSKADPKKSKKK